MAKSNGIGRKIKKALRLPYIMFYKMKGMKIGLTSSFPIETVIENCEKIKIGNHCNFDKRTILRVFDDKNTKSKIIIGDNFCGGNDLKILCCGTVVLGNDITCAGNVFITSENHGLNPLTKSFNDNDLESSNVKIEDGVWLGEKVIVLPGVTIGKKSVVGAGSVVTKDIPEYSIAVGNPAKVIKKYDFRLKKYVSTEKGEK